MWKDYEEIDWENWEYDENGEWVNYNTVSTYDEEEKLVFKDANWVQLLGWETVAAIKDLPVKWWADIKRWDKFKNIKLTDDVDLIESGKMVLRCEFFKKI